MAFTWVPFYKELAVKLLDYRDRQPELISFLNDLKKKQHKVVPLTDHFPNKDHDIPLDEIDPFTFFANFNRGTTDDNRVKLLRAIKNYFSVAAEVPSDFSGIPVVHNMRSWFFGWKYDRKDQVPELWKLAEVAAQKGPETLDPVLYEQTTARGLVMMTMGLYWLNPDHYVALDKVMLPFLGKHGVAVDRDDAKTLPGYLEIIEKVRARFPKKFWEISYDAWVEKQGADGSPPTDKPAGPKSPPTSVEVTPQYWVYAPGRQAKYWEECHQQGIMVYGADLLPALTQFGSREEIADAIKTKYDREQEPSNDSLAAWEFSRVLKPGDIVIPKRGRSTYLGYGVVSGPYKYDPSRAEYKHVRTVDWKKHGEWTETEGPIVLKTLTNITKYPEYVARLQTLIGIEAASPGPRRDHALNTILFGPPGTGKTYRLKNEYFARFTDRTIQSREEFIAKLVEGMAWWEVITTVMLELGEARVTQILEHPLLQARIAASRNRNPRAAVWAHIQMHTKNECENVRYTKRYDPLLFWKDEHSVWSIDKDLAKEEVPELHETLQQYQEFKPQETVEERFVFTTFHQSYTYEDFIEGIKPVLVDDADETPDDRNEIAYALVPGVFRKIAAVAAANPQKDHALFIDEINRGNVASIFGELITLIEEDKRAGAPNALVATLPYSRDKFTVPSNLFIVGTMNTADRSVEALDTALRRRFSFVEIRPQPELIQQPTGLDVDLQKLLIALNTRIERLLDKDHCIGHAYFMAIAGDRDALGQVKEVFATKILPLLEEYFYNDPMKLGMVLGKSFVVLKELEGGFGSGDWDTDEFEEREIYEIKNPRDLDAAAFRAIYE